MQMPRIVVGVDGSEHARRAVRSAVEEARRRGAALTVVHAVSESGMFADPVSHPGPRREQLRSAGAELVEQALDGADVNGLELDRVVRIGNTTRVLCEAAADAELLVVGSRGLGGFRGLLVGSVTQQVIAHAPCPILVVVPETASAEARSL
jgi:nucleotide-binding universal stress UspA family protein